MTTETHVKELLLSELTQIITDLKQVAVQNEVTEDWEAVPIASELLEADENNEADAVEEWNERHATVSALETSYRNVKRALLKLETGIYGACEICSEPIEPLRLAVQPAARTCKIHMDDERNLPL